MDWQSAFNVAIAAVGVLGGWILRTLWQAQRDLNKDMKRIEAALPETYVRRDSFIEFRRELFETLNRIEKKIDRKADKA